jgi:hypothetical protein
MSVERPTAMSETTTYVRRAQPPGRAALVLAALVIGVLLMGIQLWLLTVALDLYLGGHSTGSIWILALCSGGVFLGGLSILYVLDRQPRVRG